MDVPIPTEAHPDDREFEGRFEGFSPLGVALLALGFFAGILALARPLAPRIDPLTTPKPRDAGELETFLAAVVRAEGQPILLLGDSVLAGSGLAAHAVVDWKRHTLAGRMRQEAHPALAPEVFDLSYDGMLPADMLAIVRRLDELDPEGRVALVVELSPRYLSRSYDHPARAFSRPFLAEGAGQEVESALVDQALPASIQAALRDRAGLAHARTHLPPAWIDPASLWTGRPPTPPTVEQRSLHRARVRPHFLELTEGPGGLQAEALRALARSTAERARFALFFVTPLEETYFGEDPAIAEALWNATARFRPLVAGADAEENRFLNLNDHLFGPGHFYDHCHLTPEGNGLLARRLLQALAVPLERPTDGWEHGVQSHADYAYLLGDDANGHTNGVGLQVRFGERKSFAAVSPDLLVIADTENQALRRVHVPSGTSEDLRGEAFATSAGFHPETVVADGSGGAFFFDGSSARVGHVDRRGAVHALPTCEGSVPWSPDAGVILVPRSEDLLVYDRSHKLLFRLEPDTGCAEQVETPKHLPRLKRLVTVGDALVGMTWKGAVVRFRLDAPEAGVETLALGEGGPDGEEYWKLAQETYGLRQRRVDLPDVPLSRPDALFADGEGRLLVTDRYGDLGLVWLFDLEEERAFPLLPPGRDGLPFLGPYPRLSAAGPRAFDAESGILFGFSALSSRLYALDTRRFLRFDWAFGRSNPNPLGINVALQGRTLEARRGSEYRIAVFGSSVVGGSYVAQVDYRESGRTEEAAAPIFPLVSTRSIPHALEQNLRQRLGENPHELRVVDRSLPKASLIEQYVSLVACDPRDLDLALFMIDGGSLDRETQQGELPFALQWELLAREGDGLPVVGRENEHFPTPVFTTRPEENMGPGDPAPALEACLAEMVAWCRRAGVQPVFCDISTLDGSSSLGRSESLEESANRRLAAQVLARLEVPHWQSEGYLAARSGDLYPLSIENNRHLTDQGHEALGSFLASRLVGTVGAALQGREAKLAARLEGLAEQPAARPQLRSLTGRALKPVVANEHGAFPERLQRGREGSTVSFLMDCAEPPAAAWKSALAAFGLGLGRDLWEGDRVTIRLVRFVSYDEYGRGARESSQPLGAFAIAPEHLARAVAELEAVLGGSEAPPWLVSIRP